jgi:hypothetical protein
VTRRAIPTDRLFAARRDGTLVAMCLAMSDFDPTSGALSDSQAPRPARVHRVRCPGIAHRSGGICLVCDADSDGTIEVNLTDADLDALARAAQGLRVDASLALRLRRLGLLLEEDGFLVPTAYVTPH